MSSSRGAAARRRPAAAPATAAETSKDNPWPVRALAQRMAGYLAKAPAAWIEGQVAQIDQCDTNVVYLTLRDPAADISMSVTCLRSTLAALPRPPTEGDRVVVHGKYDYWAARGQLNFKVDEIHPVGLGELLLRLERVRQLLAAEGLTDPERKRGCRSCRATVGLITGRASAAESDVLANARARWPAVRFRVAHAAVQGVGAVPQILDALALLDADPEVDVIVLARGGGSAEDLLPFSDEALCRAVARCRTPVVAADRPRTRPSDRRRRRRRALLDADRRRASGWSRTRVPNCARSTACAAGPGGRWPAGCAPSRPSSARLTDGRGARRSARPARIGVPNDIDRLADALPRGRSPTTLDRIDRDLAHRRAQLAALGPASTLARGYAVVQAAGHVLRFGGRRAGRGHVAHPGGRRRGAGRQRRPGTGEVAPATPEEATQQDRDTEPDARKAAP